MEGLRKAALVLCAVLMLCTVAAAESEWDTDSFDWNTTSSSPLIQPEQSEPSPGGAAPAVPDAIDNRIPDESSSQMDDSLWGSYGTHNNRPNIEAPSE